MDRDVRVLRAALIALALTFTILPLLAALPLFDPDEGLHAAIAQEMATRGDYVTPTFVGEPFLDKPILFFWSEAWSIRALGSNEAAVRVPPLLFGLLGVASTWLLARAMLGDAGAALGAAIAYASMLLPLAVSQVAVHDVGLAPLMNVAVLALWRVADGRPSWSITVAGGVCLGLSILTKGLVGVTFAGFALVAFAAVRSGAALRLVAAFAVLLAIAVAVASPWYVAMERAHPGYLHYYFIDRHLRGFLTASQPHAEERWWYYVPVIVVGVVPWTVYVWSAVRENARRRALAACWIWFGLGFAFLTLSRSKLVTYALPLFPALAIVLGSTWVRGLRAGGGSFRAALRAHLILMFAVALAGMILTAQRFNVTFPPAAWAAAIAVMMTPLMIAWRARRRGRVVAAVACASAAAFAVALTLVLPSAARQLSERELARFFNGRGVLPPRVFLAGDRVGSIVFYLTPALRADLFPNRIESVDLYQVPERLGSVPPDTVVCVRSHRLPKFDRFFVNRPLPFAVTPDGEYHLYLVRELIDAIR
ncbi:MAG: hypothetical protein DMF86_07635 [Acidobacteria bacterium]|nr:MAG: hypothetical protein DMF86_07635 [Acidobacteriota bacterium]